jgi:hypothetical protein
MGKRIALTGTPREEILASLKRKGICQEAQKEIPISNQLHPSETSTTIHNIVTGLYEYVWKALAFNEPLWMNVNASTSLGLLAAAAREIWNLVRRCVRTEL